MGTESSPYIRFRLGNIDSYQSSPTTYDGAFNKVPVIRIWGAADESGQKVPLLTPVTYSQSCHRFAAMSMESILIATSSIPGT